MANFYVAKKKIKKTSKQQKLIIEKLDQKFQGIGYLDNKVVFVPQTLPGEEVLMQVTNDRKKYATGKLIEVLKPAPQRIAPSCDHYGICGGCQTQLVGNEYQLEVKQDALRNRMRFVAQSTQWLPAITSASWHYRRRARVGVQVDKKGQLALGFRQQGSNDLVNIKQCSVLVAPFDQLFTPLYDLLNQLTVKSDIGHLEFITCDSGHYIIIRLMKSFKTKDIERLQDFEIAHQVQFLIQDNQGEITQYDGQTASLLSYQLNQDKLEFSAGDFIQVNAKVNQKMVEQAVAWLELKSTDKVLDLFCGVGNFSLSIARQAQMVVGVEGVKAMVERATSNASNAQLSNLTFHHSDLNQPLSEQAWYRNQLGQQVDKILLDPARDGALAIAEQLSSLKPQLIVYISCEPASLERDSQVIINQGYRLEKISVMDMFPQTTHLESMALFRKI
ncbi:MAG: 23S rRNA (uracil(1939)-C(5))-methyltransferase RlmD [Gammaproteobacteria bacterium]|nr:23S rRNA (uracil(1939)-C(5))-methyltransferase RlmD [Gammaproteobacteria bacterium]